MPKKTTKPTEKAISVVQKSGESAADLTERIAKETVKQKSTALANSNQPDKIVKRKKVNRPDLENYGHEFAEPGDNARYLRYARVGMNLPPIDVSDPVQVENRINEYFDFCEQNDRKPSMMGLSNWLGVDISTFDSWKRGEYRALTHSPIIRKAAAAMKEMWADYMQNGKINPVSGIFLGKIYFGLRDQQEVIVTPNNPLGDAEATPQLADRYLEVVDTD